MRVRPYVLVGAGAIQSAIAGARAAVDAWRETWGFEDDAQVSCIRASEADSLHGPGWRAWHKDGVPGAWVRLAPDEAAAPGSIAHAVAERARRDLVASLAAAFGARADGEFAAEPIPHEARAVGAGMIVIRVAWPGAAIEMLVASAPPANGPAQHRSAPIAPAEAIRGATVRLSAEVGQVEIDLRALRALAPGDVIRLGRSLDEPLTLVAPGGDTVCHGHLGASAGRRALDVVP